MRGFRDCRCFFFQAEDGIRDYKVTGVQTCALPICGAESSADASAKDSAPQAVSADRAERLSATAAMWRITRGFLPGCGSRPASSGGGGSGERRVGEEGRSRWAPDHLKKKKEVHARR